MGRRPLRPTTAPLATPATQWPPALLRRAGRRPPLRCLQRRRPASDRTLPTAARPAKHPRRPPSRRGGGGPRATTRSGPNHAMWRRGPASPPQLAEACGPPSPHSRLRPSRRPGGARRHPTETKLAAMTGGGDRHASRGAPSKPTRTTCLPGQPSDECGRSWVAGLRLRTHEMGPREATEAPCGPAAAWSGSRAANELRAPRGNKTQLHEDERAHSRAPASAESPV